MRVWLEALTPKQGRLMVALSNYMEKLGHETFITTRNYEYSVSTIKRLHKEPIIIGEHGGADLSSKLKSYAKRVELLTNYVTEQQPDLFIGFSSPEGTRVAFGLSIPSINFNDTPHAVAVAKLAFPLSTQIVLPECISPSEFPLLEDNREREKVVQYYGVDEVSWTKKFKPETKTLDSIGIDYKNDTIMLVRPEEKKAAYYKPELRKKVKNVLINVLKKLKQNNNSLKVVVFPRYKDQEEAYRKLGDWVIIPEQAIDTLSVMYYSQLVITGGGTLSREGALLGTPSITFFPRPLKVNQFLAELGFPVYHAIDAEHLYSMALKLFGKKTDVQQLISQLQSPEEGLQKALDKMKEKNII